jgi:uncharacterized membrane protein YfcA
VSAIVLVLLAGFAAGALNAVGGGGTFVALPALVAAGLPPVTANAASTVALVPGSLASAWVYRPDVRPVGATSTRALTAASMAPCRGCSRSPPWCWRSAAAPSAS